MFSNESNCAAWIGEANLSLSWWFLKLQFTHGNWFSLNLQRKVENVIFNYFHGCMMSYFLWIFPMNNFMVWLKTFRKVSYSYLPSVVYFGYNKNHLLYAICHNVFRHLCHAHVTHDDVHVTGPLCGEFTGHQYRGALMFSLVCARANG